MSDVETPGDVPRPKERSGPVSWGALLALLLVLAVAGLVALDWNTKRLLVARDARMNQEAEAIADLRDLARTSVRVILKDSKHMNPSGNKAYFDEAGTLHKAQSFPTWRQR